MIEKKTFETKEELYDYIEENLPGRVNGKRVLKPVFFCTNCNSVIITDPEFLSFFLTNFPKDDPRDIIKHRINCCDSVDIYFANMNNIGNFDRYMPRDPKTLFIIDGDVIYSDIVANNFIK